jgi:hypothetical protein
MRAGRALVVPEYRHVSMRLTPSIPTIEELAASTGAFLRAMRYDKVGGVLCVCLACVWCLCVFGACVFWCM